MRKNIAQDIERVSAESITSEFDLINRYFRSLTAQRSDVVLGIGDDCAILRVSEGQELAVSSDTLVAGVHFPVETSADDIGYKALAVNLSDLAAMGAQPAWLMLSLTLPDTNTDWLQRFVRGLHTLMDTHRVQLIGGDTTRGPLSMTLQVFGFLPAGKSLRRSHAKPGDRVYVSGTLGDAGLGLQQIMGRIPAMPVLRHCRDRLNRPTPRIELGRALLAVSACAIDISDGLLADLGHITEESHCGAVIHLDRLPLSEELKSHYGETIDWQSILTAGDDYELCFTIAPAQGDAIRTLAARLDLALTCIGEITEGQGVRCLDADGRDVVLSRAGFDHFK